MNNKVLVTYASRAGSTVGIAQAIGKTLADGGLSVDGRPMQDVQDISMYSAVIAGSAIRMDQWLPEAKEFVRRFQAELMQKQFAAFVVCLAMATQHEKRREKAKVTAAGYLNPIRELAPTVSEGLFAGVLDLSKLPLRYRIPFGLLTLVGLFKEGDYRDWNAIEAWSQSLIPQLVA